MGKSEVLYFFREKDFLSQWYYSPFTINNIKFYCCEQWMMYSKAILFKDIESARRILKEKSPGCQKELGRTVKGFRKQVWDSHKEKIVFHGNLAKFSQNEKLRELLLSAENMLLAEANPSDSIWGIGLSEEEAQLRDVSEWRGKNLLGRILMKVRDELNNHHNN